MISKIITSEHNQNFVMKGDEMLYHEGSQGEGYTQLAIKIVEEANVDESMMRCSDRHKRIMPGEVDEGLDAALEHIEIMLESSAETEGSDHVTKRGG